MPPDIALIAVLIAAALFIIVLAGWAGLLDGVIRYLSDRPIGAARKATRRIRERIIGRIRRSIGNRRVFNRRRNRGDNSGLEG